MTRSIERSQVQLLYLGKLSRPKYYEFSLKLLISRCYNTRILTAKLSQYYYVAHYVWPYHETVRMSSVCLSVTCHISKTEPDRAIVTMDHYIEVGCN